MSIEQREPGTSGSGGVADEFQAGHSEQWRGSGAGLHGRRLQAAGPRSHFGSQQVPRVRTHNQNMTVAAMQMAERNSSPHLS